MTIVTVGTGIESCRAALELAQLHEEVFAALGIDPHQAGEPDAGRVDELRDLLEHDEAVAIVSHGLVTVVRRRRREFALLKTLGFTRRQVSSSVAWQATTIGVAALAFGIPLGVVLGRWAWTTLADDLGTVAEPLVPVALLALVIPVVLLVLNLVAYLPGRMAARLRPAAALRSE